MDTSVHNQDDIALAKSFLDIIKNEVVMANESHFMDKIADQLIWCVKNSDRYKISFQIFDDSIGHFIYAQFRKGKLEDIFVVNIRNKVLIYDRKKILKIVSGT